MKLNLRSSASLPLGMSTPDPTPMTETPNIDYVDGGEGFIKWCEEKVWIPIYPFEANGTQHASTWWPIGDLPDVNHPETGRSYRYIWKKQCEVFLEALQMMNGLFKYRLIVFCWPRGDGKSLDACLVQLWKFFNFPRQQITLGANSKDQVQFVHFDIMSDIIQNSPPLLKDIGGKKNVKVKELRLKSADGQIRSKIKAISSFSGIVSNITGYTFSEIFDMKNPKFYVQLDGSIRNIPNALGVIDSTVSTKTHILYQLYEGWREGRTTTVFFSYRCSPEANPDDYWNPLMTAAQLDDYREKFPLGEFERYFKNTWEAGQVQIFQPWMVEGMRYLGVDGQIDWNEARAGARRVQDLKGQLVDISGKGFIDGEEKVRGEISRIRSRMWPVESLYRLKTQVGLERVALQDELAQLGELFNTDWAILTGGDFGDPLATSGKARTIYAAVAKGLKDSRGKVFNPDEYPYLKYIYFVIALREAPDHSLDTMKIFIDDTLNEIGWVDTWCSERYRAWDMGNWCEDRGIQFDPIYPAYERQKEAAKEIYLSCSEGRFKCPPVGIMGSKKPDILEEELEILHHDMDKKWIGSPEKFEKDGIQDDAVYSIMWTVYGGREIGPDKFRALTPTNPFGFFYQNKAVRGNY